MVWKGVVNVWQDGRRSDTLGVMPRTKSLTLGLDENAEVLSVSALNREVRQLVEENLGHVWVEGEISNLARPSSGHIYFSLKDPKAQVRCAMFRQANRRIGFTPADGMQVLVRAQVSIYEPRGDYQLIVEHMEEAGEGALRRRFEALKLTLAEEGLFDEERKQELPKLPERIGVITSPTGAALRDVLTALKRRFPAVEVLIYPTSVQGDSAAPGIVAALERASARAECDLLILTRGGGSLEDLWPFNEEIVARAVAAVPIPIIVGVGHETDFTIAEFVADLRAPTPSQAAELAVPEQRDYTERLLGISEMLARSLRRLIRDEARRIDTLEHRLARAHPGVALKAKRERISVFEARLRRSLIQVMDQAKARTALIERSLTALSPLATLERGYAIVTRIEDRKLVTRHDAVGKGDLLDIRLAEGEMTATVESTRNNRQS
jgi:exodeoxyribonuclease VII large subunit